MDKKVVVLIDFANIDRAAKDKGVRIDYKVLLNYLADENEGRLLVEAFCYYPIDPRAPHARDRELEELSMDGFLMRSKIGTFAGDTYKCNFDVEITMDMMRVAHIVRPDIVVLCSGDADFVPVISYLRELGVRVELAAFLRSTGRGALLKSSSFIDLDVFLDGLVPGETAVAPAVPDV